MRGCQAVAVLVGMALLGCARPSSQSAEPTVASAMSTAKPEPEPESFADETTEATPPEPEPEGPQPEPEAEPESSDPATANPAASVVDLRAVITSQDLGVPFYPGATMVDSHSTEADGRLTQEAHLVTDHTLYTVYRYYDRKLEEPLVASELSGHGADEEGILAKVTEGVEYTVRLKVVDGRTNVVLTRTEPLDADGAASPER